MFRQEHLPISTLSDLREHLEITLPQSGTALPERDALPTSEPGPGGLVFFWVEILVGLFPVFGATPAGVDVGYEVVVVVVEV